MYAHSYAQVLLHYRESDLFAAAERRNRTSSTRPKRRIKLR